jgi:hypothetical protein
MSARGLRLRTLVADNYWAIVLAVVLVGAVGGFLTYATYVDPGTQTETRTVSTWQSSGAFAHEATVVNDTAVFSEGQTLRNRNVYFQELTPRLNGSFTYTYSATHGGDLHVDTTVALVYRSVEGSTEGESTVLWRETRVLNRRDYQSLSPGERAPVSFSTNVSSAATTVEQIDEQLGGTPGDLQVVIVATADVTGTRNGQSVATTRTYRLPIEPGDGVYRVPVPDPTTQSGQETETVTVPETDGPLRQVAGPLLVVLALVAGVGLVHGKRRDRFSITTAERDWLTYRNERDEFDEWITTGHVPRADQALETVDVESLEGLVDVAIDTNSRVIEDDQRGACFVFSEGRRFRFDRPRDPTDTPVAEGSE